MGRLPSASRNRLERYFAQTSVSVRLWFFLVGCAFVLSLLATGIGSFIIIASNLSARADQAESTARATAMLVQQGTTSALFQPATAMNRIGSQFGLLSVQSLDSSGNAIASVYFSPGGPLGPLDAATMARVSGGASIQRTIQVNGDGIAPQTVSGPVALVTGKVLGKEVLVPAGDLRPGSEGIIRIVISYGPGLTRQSQDILALGFISLFVIDGFVAILLWSTLRIVIATPLRRFSDTAARIAGGEPVRLEPGGGTELTLLANSVNFLADALARDAETDSLTGLLNRRHLSANLEAMLNASVARNAPFALISADLDRLKWINDGFGHAAGDAVLESIGATIARLVGGSAVAWRTGGDEFIIALPGATPAEARDRAAGLKEAIERDAVEFESGAVRPRVSVGVACYPDDGLAAADLVESADKRMYAAKVEARRRFIETAA